MRLRPPTARRYHLGEHKLPFGKGEPYDTDVRLPMYIRGPGVVANATRPHATNHIDLTATVVEWGNAGGFVAGPPLDGKSFAAVLGPAPPPPADWRPVVYSEFFGLNNTWAKMRNPSAGWSLHWWCTGDAEVFQFGAGDPWELENVAAQAAGRAVVAANLPTLLGFTKCAGAGCSAPAATDAPLPCYVTGEITGESHVYDP